MWFKNLIFYRFTQPFSLSVEELEDKLKEKRFRSCGSQDMSTYGWVPPLGRHGSMLTHAASGFIMITARKEEKILPASVINEVLEERVEKIEQEQDRQVFSKEKKTLKDDVLMELLPKAFSRSQNTFAYIDTVKGWLIVDASSFKKAEELTSCLRECMGSLPIVNPPLKNMPSFAMTRWLAQEVPLPDHLILGDECELREPGDEGGQVKVSKQELAGEEVEVHLQAGKQVSKMAVIWNDALSFVLGDDLVIRKLKFTDSIQEKLDEVNTETAAEQFDADFALMTMTLQQMLEELIEYLGGISEEAMERKEVASFDVGAKEEAPF
ncbi:recombination-associated protein RdgC [Endozoicomonas ascidiicola]|uniref:recombination-associated protein RdgC n=1 Tax=Endozoicomonas ascidiicola TaxID=1698521 RepID=UPI00082C475B|nr:recombination-associated protein RdgC [Endozoicomonas ascidiicola]